MNNTASTSNDTLRLALAMALGHIRPAYLNRDGEVLIDLANGTSLLFAPLLNVKDDHTVLLWLKTKQNYSQLNVLFELRGIPDYKVGDYARAAFILLQDDTTLKERLPGCLDDTPCLVTDNKK